MGETKFMATTEDIQSKWNRQWLKSKHIILSGHSDPFDYPSQSLHIQLQNVQMANFTMNKQKLTLFVNWATKDLNRPNTQPLPPMRTERLKNS
jgi:hypothetical protein